MSATGKSLRELDVDTCLRLLAGRPVGRVAFNDDDGPVVLPVNYVLDGGTILFRTDLGSKLEAAEGRDEVAFEVDDFDVTRRLGWSVLVRGRLEEIVDAEELDRVASLGLQPFAPGDKAHHVRIAPRVITGRAIPLPDTIPSDWLTSTDHVWFGRDGDDLLA